MDRHVKPRSGVEGEAPAALPLEGATRAPKIDVKPRSGVEGEAPAALPLEGATRAPMIDTPLMRQYWAIKKQHRDAILFFRLGDFYEMFFEDAEVASKILEIALTSRDKSADNPVPLCGVPYHSANGYISRLLDRGHKVAICEQVEDPKLAKGIVRREVVRVITPGIRTDEEGLSSKEANPLVSVCRDSKSIGLAWMDVSSGHFEATSFDRPDQALEEVERLRPRELLRPEKAKGANSESWLADDRFEKNGVRSELIPEWVYENADRKLCERFGVASVIGFGIPESGPVGGAAYALLYYVEEANRTLLPHLTPPKPYQTNDFVGMDRATVENLEIFRERNANALGKERSLLGILDETETAGGGRMLRDWLHFPLRDLDRIHRRLEAVGQLAERGDIREELRRLLARTHDVERIVGKIAGRRASPRDCAALRATLTHVVSLRDLVASLDAGSFSGLRERLDPHTALRTLLHQSLADEPPLLLKDGDVIRDGFDAGLDELRALTSGGRDWIAQLEATEKKRTGISSLKVGYNRVFGYYIEVTKTHLQKVPEDYIRKQTLAGAERFVTPDLKEKETQILEAEEKLAQVEAELFDRLCRTISESTRSLQSLGAALAELDVYASFARVATQYDYVHPKVTDRDEIRIKAGRHPVVERFSSDPFVPNDILLSAGERQMLILTGPNMAGKSTIMRQVALITLLAHVGSFVPAEAAEIGLVDQIFTRVGASDDLARGRSTFMVEMNETANILRNATNRSLVLLDEIGRGTSTFDGLSIAWAVAEEIHDRLGAKTIFATHYHELTDLARTKPRVRNLNVAVKQWGNKIVFLRTLTEGAVNRSYGIEVAQLAGVPASVITRAREILKNLERSELDAMGHPVLASSANEAPRTGQLDLFRRMADELLDELGRTNPDAMSPKEASDLLYAWCGRFRITD